MVHVVLNVICLINIQNNIYIQHAENDNEYLIPNTCFHANRYCKETNRIYEFHGDLWHGNLKLYQKTLERE